MDERRSALEWLFEILAAIGVFVTLVGTFFFRYTYPPDFDFGALPYATGGLALSLGAIAGSRWAKRKRLAALMNSRQSGVGNAN
jgi:hypothetical protein